MNNAGIDLMLPVPGGDPSTVQRVFDVNFFATVTGTLAVVPAMVERGRGVVVNVSSDTVRAPEPRQGAYAASKAAVSAFSESVAYEVARRGVHVHVLYPGWVPTAMGLSEGDEDGDSAAAARWCGARPCRWPRSPRTGWAGPASTSTRRGCPLLAPIARTMAPLLYPRPCGAWPPGAEPSGASTPSPPRSR